MIITTIFIRWLSWNVRFTNHKEWHDIDIETDPVLICQDECRILPFCHTWTRAPRVAQSRCHNTRETEWSPSSVWWPGHCLGWGWCRWCHCPSNIMHEYRQYGHHDVVSLCSWEAGCCHTLSWSWPRCVQCAAARDSSCLRCWTITPCLPTSVGTNKIRNHRSRVVTRPLELSINTSSVSIWLFETDMSPGIFPPTPSGYWVRQLLCHQLLHS